MIARTPETEAPVDLDAFAYVESGRDGRTVEEICEAFDAGMIGNEPERPIYPEGFEVPVCPPEVPPPRPRITEAELLLDAEKAERLLDDAAPQWRSWGRPPGIYCHGRGWSCVMFSESELREWIEQRGARWRRYV